MDGCQSPEDDTEQDLPVTECSDGYDNDLDGRTDYPRDSGCSFEFDESESGTKGKPA